MKTLDEIKNEVARSVYKCISWDDLEYSSQVRLINKLAERYANERCVELQSENSSLRAEIESLKSEIVVLKALKREN